MSWTRAYNNPKARRNSPVEDPMIPLDFPLKDYQWGTPSPHANWTSYPTYAYEQFFRSNPSKARKNRSAEMPRYLVEYRMPRSSQWEWSVVAARTPAEAERVLCTHRTGVDKKTIVVSTASADTLKKWDAGQEAQNNPRPAISYKAWLGAMERAKAQGKHGKHLVKLLEHAMETGTVATPKSLKAAANPWPNQGDTEAALPNPVRHRSQMTAAQRAKKPTYWQKEKRDAKILDRLDLRRYMSPGTTKAEAKKKQSAAYWKQQHEEDRMEMYDAIGPLETYDNPRRSKKNPIKTVYTEMPTNAGPYLPDIFPYGQGGRPAVYEEAKKNTYLGEFLKPKTRSWPVYDKKHAKIAIQYMTRGFGKSAEYPELIRNLAKHWPVADHPDIWAVYRKNREKIEKHGVRMPKL